MSRRADLWDTFAHAVRCHINDYTVPQYGDAPGDLLESMSVDECVHQIRKYAQRHGRNSRDGQDERDMLKLAHYAAEAWRKMRDEK